MICVFILVCLLQGLLLTRTTQVDDLFPLSDISERQSCTTPSFEPTHTDVTDFNNQALAWHNYFRCQHGVSNMVLDSRLQTAAQAWADNLAVRLKTTWNSSPMHSTDRCGDGENIWLGYGKSNYPAWKVVRGDATQFKYGYGWYCSEYASFDWNAGSYTMAAGHFSQVIWKDSTKLGCGVAFTSGGSPDKTIVVCQYSPTGNLQSSGCWAGGNSALKPWISGITSANVCPVGSNS